MDESDNWQDNIVREEIEDRDTQNNSNQGSDQKPSRDENVHSHQRYTYHNELDQEKVTGDFDRASDMDQLDIYRQNSYLDTYDPAYKDDLYTNTATNTEFPDTVNHTDSDYLIQSSDTSRHELN